MQYTSHTPEKIRALFPRIVCIHCIHYYVDDSFAPGQVQCQANPLPVSEDILSGQKECPFYQRNLDTYINKN